MSWQIINKKEVYDNPWISVTEYDVINPAGGEGIYGKVHYKNRCVAICPILDNNKIVLVGQDRFPINSYSWEIPKGGIEPNEDAVAAGKRELLEETGLIAQNWTELLQLDISNSISDEHAIAFYCTDISLGEANPDETEVIETKIVDFNSAFEMVMNGEIRDAVSCNVILKMKFLIDNGEL